MNIKLTYHTRLYIGDSIKNVKIEKLKKRLEKWTLFTGYFLIVISDHESEQLEFYQAKQIVQKYYRNSNPYIIGIASNYDEAVLLVQEIVKDCLKEQGNCNLKEYLLCGQ